MGERCDNVVEQFEGDDSNLKLISLMCGSKGLGIRLSKSSWDPYPFISHVDDDSKAHERGLCVGDCVLKVNSR
jgi:C-terminal processing protease CtpA/Prc